MTDWRDEPIYRVMAHGMAIEQRRDRWKRYARRLYRERADLRNSLEETSKLLTKVEHGRP